MLYERTAIAKKPEDIVRLEIEGLRKQDLLTLNLILGFIIIGDVRQHRFTLGFIGLSKQESPLP